MTAFKALGSADVRWQPLALASVFAAYLLIWMEWIFFVTKLSFLSVAAWHIRLGVAFLAPLPFVVVSLCVVFLAWGVARGARGTRARRIAGGVAFLPPSVLFAALGLLLVDNFTNTLFGFGVQKMEPHWNLLYIPLLLGLFAAGLRSTRGLVSVLGRRNARVFAALGYGLLALSVLLGGVTFVRAQAASRKGDDPFAGLVAPQRRPNILLFGSDGVAAHRTSAYGYARSTTPQLESLVDNSLFCENAFANSSHTTGSLISILTGRSPIETRVVFPPDILTGEDAFRHFPGLLRRFGYRNLHISIRHFADAYDLNLREGFDVSTFQRPSELRLDVVLGELGGYFARQTWTRVRDRVRHTFGSTRTSAAIDEVRARTVSALPGGGGQLISHADSTRMQALVDFVRDAPAPFFAHVHLMASHGPKFPIARPVFSRGVQGMEWMPDFYDDAVLQSDQDLGRILAVLEQEGELSNTIVVVYSDHGIRGSVRQRTPLLFLFPGAERAGRIRDNVENLDIVPTLLDYMGMELPEWLSGRSLLRRAPIGATEALHDSIAAARVEPIFAASCNAAAWIKQGDLVWVDPAQVTPPFYTLRYVTMVVCNRAYTVDLLNRQVKFEDIPGHTRPCDESALPHPQEVFRSVLELLEKNGYDVSSFR